MENERRFDEGTAKHFPETVLSQLALLFPGAKLEVRMVFRTAVRLDFVALLAGVGIALALLHLMRRPESGAVNTATRGPEAIGQAHRDTRSQDRERAASATSAPLDPIALDKEVAKAFGPHTIRWPKDAIVQSSVSADPADVAVPGGAWREAARVLVEFDRNVARSFHKNQIDLLGGESVSQCASQSFSEKVRYFIVNGIVQLGMECRSHRCSIATASLASESDDSDLGPEGFQDCFARAIVGRGFDCYGCREGHFTVNWPIRRSHSKPPQMK
jgi:hypothetical protein